MSLSNSMLTPSPFPNSTAPTASVLNSALVAAACVGHATKDGDVDRILLWKTTGGTTGTLTGQLQTCTTGNPSGTLLNASATGSMTPTAGTGVGQTIALAAPVAVAKGDLFSAVIYFSVFATSTSYARIIPASFECSNIAGTVPGNRTNTNYTPGSGANWLGSTANSIGMICPVFTDGTCAMHGTYMFSSMPAYTTVPTTGVNSYYGVKWACTTTCDLEFLCDHGRSDGAKYEVYDSNNVLIGTSRTQNGGSGNTGNVFVFASPVRLTAGQTYRIVKRNVSGTNTLLVFASHSQAMQEDMYGIYCLTTSTNGTSWTDTAASTASFALGITPVAGGGGGGMMFPRGFTGGFGD